MYTAIEQYVCHATGIFCIRISQSGKCEGKNQCKEKEGMGKTHENHDLVGSSLGTKKFLQVKTRVNSWNSNRQS